MRPIQTVACAFGTAVSLIWLAALTLLALLVAGQRIAMALRARRFARQLNRILGPSRERGAA